MDPRMNSMQGLPPPLQPGMVQNPFTIGQAVDQSAMQNGLIPMQESPSQNGITPGPSPQQQAPMPMNSGAAPGMTPTNTAPMPVAPPQMPSPDQAKALAAGLAKLKGRFGAGPQMPMAGDPAPMDNVA